MDIKIKHMPEYTTGPYTTSGKRNLIHIETSTDSPEAGIHICSVPKNSPNIDLLVNSWDVHARFNAIHTGAKLAKIAGTQIDPDLILHNTIGYAVQSACTETAKQNLNLLKENQELKAELTKRDEREFEAQNTIQRQREDLKNATEFGNRKQALNAELLEALELAKRELVFLRLHDKDGKFWTKQAEADHMKICAAINKAKS